MRKLKKFSLGQARMLSSDEMVAISGGEFISSYCYYEGQKCAAATANGSGFNTGACRWYYTSLTKQELTCVIDYTSYA